MFLFYYAVLAEVTPPVGLSIYAAASVFETNPIRTGIYSALVALPKYLIGLSFICSYYGTATLILPVLEHSTALNAVLIIGSKFVLTFAAILFLNAGVIGYSWRAFSKRERVVLVTCGVALFYPHFYLNLILLVPPLFVYLKGKRLSRIMAPDAPSR